MSRISSADQKTSGSQTATSSEAKDFPTLLRALLAEGRRADGSGRPWEKAEFRKAVAEALLAGRQAFTEKQVGNWLSGANRPPKPTMEAMQNVFFAAGETRGREDFHAKWKDFRSRAAHDPTPTSTGKSSGTAFTRAGQSATLRARDLARFWIFVGGQGNTPEAFDVYLTMILGDTKVEWDGGIASISTDMVDVHLEAPGYAEQNHLNAKGNLPGVKLSTKWRFFPVPPHEILEGAPPSIAGQEYPLVHLTANTPDSADDVPLADPKIKVFIPDRTRLRIEITPGEVASKDSNTDAYHAVIAAFIKGALKETKDGIGLGEASLRPGDAQ